uniref:Phospho-N-acetylmuramoyl-pentapeptide-transferase n=1 Tax=Opuntia streptacantha TaxID=393608 RepID=A0A7C8ZV48_OPUST
MRSAPSHLPNLQVARGLGVCPCRKKVSFAGSLTKFDIFSSALRFRCQLWDSKILKQGYKLQNNVGCPTSMDQGSLGISPWDDWGSNEEPSEYLIFSSDGEDSDGEILVMPINDVDMPATKKQFVTAEDALTATAHRVAMFGKRHKRHRITYGFVTNLGLITFLILLLAFLDWCAWRIVRRPLKNFYFLSPFLASALLAACAGYVSVPVLKRFNVRRKFKRKWPVRLYFEKGTPTVGGMFFIPVGVAVAKLMSGSSTEVSGIIAVTLAFAAVGLLDDLLGLMTYHVCGLSRWTRILLEVTVAASFSFWLCTKNISSPYGMRSYPQVLY